MQGTNPPHTPNPEARTSFQSIPGALIDLPPGLKLVRVHASEFVLRLPWLTLSKEPCSVRAGAVALEVSSDLESTASARTSDVVKPALTRLTSSVLAVLAAKVHVERITLRVVDRNFDAEVCIDGLFSGAVQEIGGAIVERPSEAVRFDDMWYIYQ